MSKEKPEKKRVLGDEWSDWDGSIDIDLEKTKEKLFIWIAFFAVFAVIGAVLLFQWLIEPRIMELSPYLAQIMKYAVLIFSGILVLWLGLFVICSKFNLRLFAPILIVPRAINFLLNLALGFGQLVGIPRDRIVNSFLKVHNILLRLKRNRLNPQELLVLLPRCLRKDYFERLGKLKDLYKFNMFTVGGGTQARMKIRSLMPRAIIAVACERDLLSGFVEINPKIPVIGFPNTRPEGPCMNTEIDLEQIELTIRQVLNMERITKPLYIQI